MLFTSRIKFIVARDFVEATVMVWVQIILLLQSRFLNLIIRCIIIWLLRNPITLQFRHYKPSERMETTSSSYYIIPFMQQLGK